LGFTKPADSVKRRGHKPRLDKKTGKPLPVPALTFYEATRHSFASRALEEGNSIDEVSKALGHSCTAVTERHYAHFKRTSYSSTMLQFGSALVQAVREHLTAEVGKLVGGARGRRGAASGAAKGGRLRRGSVNEAVLSQLLSVIKRSPGLRSEQIYKKVSLTPRMAKAGLAKLRARKKVRLSGQKRA